MSEIIVRSMQGLGDNIYQRAFIYELQQSGNYDSIFIDTPFPQLYEDFPSVKFIKRRTILRTQSKNVEAYKGTYVPQPLWQCKEIKFRYNQNGGIINGMCESTGLSRPHPMSYTLPRKYFTYAKINKPIIEGEYVVVRPVTLRTESYFSSRNPDPKYILSAADILMKKRITVVSIADICPPHEVLVGDQIKADVRFDRGELNFEQLMSVMSGASAVIGGVGWIVPFAIASNIPTFCIQGGYGGCNSVPQILPYEHSLQLKPIQFCTPDYFCGCQDPRHNCNKHISNFEPKFKGFINAFFN